MLAAAYAYLAEQAEHADAVALPAYQVAGADQKDIDSASRRAALDEWLNAPPAKTAEKERRLVAYLKGTG